MIAKKEINPEKMGTGSLIFYPGKRSKKKTFQSTEFNIVIREREGHCSPILMC